MAIIKTIKSGNCTIYIDDEYAKTVTPEEKRKKLEMMSMQKQLHQKKKEKN